MTFDFSFQKFSIKELILWAWKGPFFLDCLPWFLYNMYIQEHFKKFTRWLTTNTNCLITLLIHAVLVEGQAKIWCKNAAGQNIDGLSTVAAD